MSNGQAFAQADQQFDNSTGGPLRLRDHRIARVVAEALIQGSTRYRLYELYAWVIMPNHVHVVLRSFRPLPVVMRWLKGLTARSANAILGRTGKPFWQYETYDHCIRGTEEFNRVLRYVETNPVRAGFVRAIEDWPFSRASKRTVQKAQA